MLARPLFRERHRPDMSEEEATELLHEGLRVSGCLTCMLIMGVLSLWHASCVCICGGAGVLLQGQADDKQVPDRQGHEGGSQCVGALCNPDQVGLQGKLVVQGCDRLGCITAPKISMHV